MASSYWQPQALRREGSDQQALERCWRNRRKKKNFTKITAAEIAEKLQEGDKKKHPLRGKTRWQTWIVCQEFPLPFSICLLCETFQKKSLCFNPVTPVWRKHRIWQRCSLGAHNAGRVLPRYDWGSIKVRLKSWQSNQDQPGTFNMRLWQKKASLCLISQSKDKDKGFCDCRSHGTPLNSLAQTPKLRSSTSLWCLKIIKTPTIAIYPFGVFPK